MGQSLATPSLCPPTQGPGRLHEASSWKCYGRVCRGNRCGRPGLPGQLPGLSLHSLHVAERGSGWAGPSLGPGKFLGAVRPPGTQQGVLPVPRPRVWVLGTQVWDSGLDSQPPARAPGTPKASAASGQVLSTGSLGPGRGLWVHGGPQCGVWGEASGWAEPPPAPSMALAWEARPRLGAPGEAALRAGCWPVLGPVRTRV